MKIITLICFVLSFMISNTAKIYANDNSKLFDESINTSQSSIYGQYYFGIICDGKVFIDETHKYQSYDSPSAIKYDKLWLNNSSKIKKVNNNFGYEYIQFNTTKKEFNGQTSFQIGDGAYISTVYGVFETKLIGFALLEMVSGAKLYDVFNLSKSFQNYTFGYNDGSHNDYVILSTSSDITGINNKEVRNEKIEKYLKTLRKKLVFVKGALNENFDKTSEDIKILKVNTNSENKTYAASYTYRYEGIYANAVYVFDENGNVFKTLREFRAPNKEDVKKYNYNDFGKYYTVLGTVDVNSDGVDEAILYNGSYEGGSYELWGYENGRFIRITNGLVEGV